MALNGTSLTVNAVQGNSFDVLIIRHTLEVTTWGEREVGDAMNIEIDTMARYAERILSFADKADADKADAGKADADKADADKAGADEADADKAG